MYCSREYQPTKRFIQQYEKSASNKRCRFTNDAATLRIFIKGLKNAHSSATSIYEKGPQMLTDAILEAKKA